MTVEAVVPMTRDELDTFVRNIVQEEKGTRVYRQVSNRPMSEVFEEIRKHRIIPKPGQPSTLEMLREDRDR